jgi:hypothetical protein
MPETGPSFGPWLSRFYFSFFDGAIESDQIIEFSGELKRQVGHNLLTGGPYGPSSSPMLVANRGEDLFRLDLLPALMGGTWLSATPAALPTRGIDPPGSAC